MSKAARAWGLSTSASLAVQLFLGVIRLGPAGPGSALLLSSG